MQSLPNYVEALELGLSIVKPVCVSEQLDLEYAINRILALGVLADRDEPPFHRSQMDGYAVLASEISEGKQLQVLGEVAAGTTFDGTKEPDSCVLIATGAPVPTCFDAVVQHELTDCGDEVVTFECSDVVQGKSIHRKGADAKAGDVLTPKLTRLKPQHIGIAASNGMNSISVLSKPRVIVITSGDEVVPPERQPLAHQIRNGNSPMVCEAFRSLGCDVIETHHLRDDESATQKAIEQALDGRCDLVVTVGGISAGTRDYFPTAFEHSNVKLAVKGANIQPGKPVIIGGHTNGIVLGLPGNPVSALACCCIFGWPIVLGMLGLPTALPWQTRPLAVSVKPNPKRSAFRPSQLEEGNIVIPNWQGSGDLAHTAKTNGLAQLMPSATELTAGTLVPFLEYPWSI
jgi:molybdopterin molybdotransferase